MRKSQVQPRISAVLLPLLLVFGFAPSQTALKSLSKEDLLVVVPTSIDRIKLVRAGRQWRKGISSFVVADKKLPYGEKERAGLSREKWAIYKDIAKSKLPLGPHSGDLRAAVAPFLANESVGAGSYKWILYGDDDTVFFAENVLAMLSTLDPEQPYLLSDCLWWPQGGRGAKLHPNKEAPRCLPCGYSDPAMMAGDMCTGMTGYMPVQGCPCSPQQIMEGHWKGGQPAFPDGRGILDWEAGKFVERPDDPNSPNVGWWYMIHGGGGAIISRGAMHRAHYETVESYLKGLEPQSGDAMLTKAFWNVLGIGPTDPGYGLCRPGIQMFDPGWRGARARGPEDSGTLDAGADPLGVIERLQASLDGDGTCDKACEDQLGHTISVHVRARYAAGDWAEVHNKEVQKEDNPPFYRAAAFMMRKLAVLHKKHAARRRGRGGFLPLWND